ncbi:MAG TPA: hypothetical protein VGI40_13650 [Pirellulaceae bacterium]|jgi:hypothetical protein
MSSDPVVAEVQRIREEIAASFNYDTAAILEDARKRDAAENRKFIRLPPRRPEGYTAKPQDAPSAASHGS